MRSDHNVRAKATYSFVSCRANAAQRSGNPASAVKCPGALPSYPPHPTFAPLPCLPFLLARRRFPPLFCTPVHLSSANAIAFAFPECPRISARPVPPCVPPAPLPASPRRSACPARMPAHLGPSRLHLPLPRPACPRISTWPSSARLSSPRPPHHIPTHLGPSRELLFPSSPRLPERAARRRRRRNCEPGPAYSPLDGHALMVRCGPLLREPLLEGPPPAATFTVTVAAAAAAAAAAARAAVWGCQSAAPLGFAGNESPSPPPPFPPTPPIPGPARQDPEPGTRGRTLAGLGIRKL
jgi:hypothetical protein